MIATACSTCDRIHSAGEIVAIGRFYSSRTVYRVMATGVDYKTRAEAMRAVCDGWQVDEPPC